MNKQPEALRLAELIDIDNPVYQLDVNCAKAAAELRRQYQEIQELKKAKAELLSVLKSTEFYLEVVRYNIEHHFPEMTRLQVQDTVHETLVKYKD